eukprot:8901292-Alexandrium_andersonii.AAC.1
MPFSLSPQPGELLRAAMAASHAAFMELAVKARFSCSLNKSPMNCARGVMYAACTSLESILVP